MQVERVSRIESGDENWQAWQSLLTRCRPSLALFGPEWYRMWNQYWPGKPLWTGEFEFLVARDCDGVMQGIIPIAYVKKGPLRVRAFGGYRQPARPIITADENAAEVGRAFGEFLIREKGTAIQLGPSENTCDALRTLLKTLDEAGVCVLCGRNSGLPQSVMPESWEEFKTTVLGKKRATELRRRARRLAETGDVQIEHITRIDADRVDRLIDELAMVESKSWLPKAKDGLPRFIAPEVRVFWHHLITKALVPNGQLDCWVLRVDSTAISYVFAVKSGNVLFTISNQYDEEFKKFSPGGLLYQELVQHAIETGVELIDFGEGDLHYKAEWGAVERLRDVEYLAFPKAWQATAVRLCRRLFNRPRVISDRPDMELPPAVEPVRDDPETAVVESTQPAGSQAIEVH